MINADSLSAIGSIVKDAKSAVIFLKAKPSYDQVLSALALANSLEQSAIMVEIACSDLGSVVDRFTDGHASSNTGDSAQSESGISSIKNKLGNRNLTISFPYTQEAVDSVNYHISDDGEQFYLVIKPQHGFAPLDSSQVEFDYSGVEADVIFTIGVHDWSALEYLYEAHEQLFRNSPVISIHNVQTELTPFALDTSSFGSMTEGLVWLLEGLQLVPNTTGASYLLRGIEEATDSFRSLATTADTFESVAKLMRMGARRAPRSHVMGQVRSQGKAHVQYSNTSGHKQSIVQKQPALQKSGQKNTLQKAPNTDLPRKDSLHKDLPSNESVQKDVTSKNALSKGLSQKKIDQTVPADAQFSGRSRV